MQTLWRCFMNRNDIMSWYDNSLVKFSKILMEWHFEIIHFIEIEIYFVCSEFIFRWLECDARRSFHSLISRVHVTMQIIGSKYERNMLFSESEWEKYLFYTITHEVDLKSVVFVKKKLTLNSFCVYLDRNCCECSSLCLWDWNWLQPI